MRCMSRREIEIGSMNADIEFSLGHQLGDFWKKTPTQLEGLPSGRHPLRQKAASTYLEYEKIFLPKNIESASDIALVIPGGS